MERFANMTLEELIQPEGHECTCGRCHRVGLKWVRIGRGVVEALPGALSAAGVTRPFVVCDRNTLAAAGNQVQAVLQKAGVPFVLHVFTRAQVEPDEHAVGELTMALPRECDGIVAVGSGVINDCCKVLAHAARLPQLVVATAPSMDGYASNSSSMIRSRVKVTIYNACPDAIIADTLILRNAPERMLQAGLGDMLAKYVALCEWRISHLVNGEYYCAAVAGLMRASLRKITAAAPRLMERDPEVIGAVVEGLILSGVAMSFAQVSRPASGLEHYFSHLWEMFALDRGLPLELHGIQVGVGTLLTLRIYDRLRTLTPSRKTAEAAMAAFSNETWEENVRRVFGGAAQTLIDSEHATWRKNDPSAHQARLERILTHWPQLLEIMQQELPDTQHIHALMEGAGMPMHPVDIGQSDADAYDALHSSRDIRDKYLTSSLLWDLGWLNDFPLELN